MAYFVALGATSFISTLYTVSCAAAACELAAHTRKHTGARGACLLLLLLRELLDVVVEVLGDGLRVRQHGLERLAVRLRKRRPQGFSDAGRCAAYRGRLDGRDKGLEGGQHDVGHGELRATDISSSARGFRCGVSLRGYLAVAVVHLVGDARVDEVADEANCGHSARAGDRRSANSHLAGDKAP